MDNPSKEKSSLPQRTNAFAKYTALGIQMAAVVAAGAFLGKYLDTKFPTLSPWLMVITVLLGVFASMYIVIKDVLKQK